MFRAFQSTAGRTVKVELNFPCQIKQSLLVLISLIYHVVSNISCSRHPTTSGALSSSSAQSINLTVKRQSVKSIFLLRVSSLVFNQANDTISGADTTVPTFIELAITRHQPNSLTIKSIDLSVSSASAEAETNHAVPANYRRSVGQVRLATTLSHFY